ncbi:glucosyltransferase domain-containing protein [Carnobacterium divergens]|uniref:Glucosyltransferase domain-containing protein n=1 Tax=Carnobacterium divergens TaxID=2748 RepID=A0AAW8RDV8_CARDV|nr:glucosyltransferase domain-containing protein [Carnobacterium divergens]MDT1957612.1 glucosyltransferase domain-containing protein [Carnobacterium divergens]MDT1974306.1 glucosyltransferase domain-containing protein [Carnobacterium divergens]
MNQFFKNEKQHLLRFARESKPLIIVTLFFIILTYGIKLAYLDYSIDTEAIITNFGGQMAAWRTIDRIGLVFSKKLFSQNFFNPFVANFLTYFFLFLTCFLLCYLIYRILGKYTNKIGLLSLTIIFLTHPIFAEQFNFILQSFEVSLAMFFIVLALLLTYFSIETKKKLFALPAIILVSWAFLTYQALLLFYIAGAIASVLLILHVQQNETSDFKLMDYCFIILKYLIVFVGSLILAKALIYLNSKLITTAGSAYLSQQILWGKLPLDDILDRITTQIKIAVLGKGLFYNYSFLLTILLTVPILISKIIKKVHFIYLEIFCLALLYLSPFLLTIFIGNAEAIRAQMPTVQFVIAFNFYYVLLHFKNNILQKILFIVSIIIAFQQSTTTANLLYSEHVKFNEDVTFANRINTQLDSLGINNPSDYSLLILGAHTPKSSALIPGESLSHSFFAWDIGTTYGTSIRTVGFMNTLGYPFKLPNENDAILGSTIREELSNFPSKNSIKIVDKTIFIKLSDD